MTPKPCSPSSDKNPFDVLAERGGLRPGAMGLLSVDRGDRASEPSVLLTPGHAHGRMASVQSAAADALPAESDDFLMRLPPPKSPAPPKPATRNTGFAKGYLKLEILAGRNLAVTKPVQSRPYVLVQFDKNEYIGDADASAKDARAPTWNESVIFDVTVENQMVQLHVYDRLGDTEQLIGVREIRPRLIPRSTFKRWFTIFAPAGSGADEALPRGEVQLQLSYDLAAVRRLTAKDFEFMKLIGRGTFGRVFQVRKKDTKRIYAMKVLSKREIALKKEVTHTMGERKILEKSLDCPFLVGLKFSFQSETELFLVTDYKSGGELFWHLQREGRFTEARSRFYIAELVLALEHLHKYDIVYRDLKPENILLDATGHVALCDFGLSKPDLGPGQLTNTFCGTTEYLAPEILLDEMGYSKLVDFWSLGVLLFEMCCGWSPFYADDTQQMYRNICFGKIRFPRGAISDDGKQFVKGLLNRNPKHRLGAVSDAAELKAHPFFTSVDWEALAHKRIPPVFKPLVESNESVANFDPEFTNADVHEVAGFSLSDDEDPGPESVASPEPDKPHGKGVAIARVARRTSDDPLSSSIQEKFRGFSYCGESGEDDMAALEHGLHAIDWHEHDSRDTS